MQLVQSDILAHERMQHSEQQARKALDAVLNPVVAGPSTALYVEDDWMAGLETPENTSFLGREPNKRPRSEIGLE
jgi:hypothetical protein